MELIGQYDSPFVRRVAITLAHYGLAFSHRQLSVFDDFESLLTENPLGKVPALRLANGELLFDSQMILDYLDETVGPERSLTPASGERRRALLRRVTVAMGMAEKVVALRGERLRRPAEKQDDPTAERLVTQVSSALVWLEGCRPDPWLSGTSPGQDDVAVAVAYRYYLERFPGAPPSKSLPGLEALTARAEALPAFRAIPFPRT